MTDFEAGDAATDTAPPQDFEPSPDQDMSAGGAMAQARAAGHSWDQINTHIAGASQEAANAGYSQDEIDQHLGYRDPSSMQDRLRAQWTAHMTGNPDVLKDFAAPEPKLDLTANPTWRSDYSRALLAGEVKGPRDFSDQYAAAALDTAHDTLGLDRGNTGAYKARVDAAAGASDAMLPQLPSHRDLIDSAISLAPLPHFPVRPRDNPEDMFSDEENLARNQQFIKPGFKGPYLTTLPPEEEAKYQDWLKHNPTGKPINWREGEKDYDMRGFWKAAQEGNPIAVKGMRIDPNDGRIHFPDEWKTPYAATYSSSSMGAGPNAPQWRGNIYTLPNGTVWYDDNTGQWMGPGARHPGSETEQYSRNDVVQWPQFHQQIKQNLLDHWQATGQHPVPAAMAAHNDPSLWSRLTSAASAKWHDMEQRDLAADRLAEQNRKLMEQTPSGRLAEMAASFNPFLSAIHLGQEVQLHGASPATVDALANVPQTHMAYVHTADPSQPPGQATSIKPLGDLLHPGIRAIHHVAAQVASMATDAVPGFLHRLLNDESGGLAPLRQRLMQSQAADVVPNGERVENPIEAWHGSPHDFDEFDINKIGTGEGGQAYSRGLYYSSANRVSERYKDDLSDWSINGKPIDNLNPTHLAAGFLQGANGDYDEALENAAEQHRITQESSTGAESDPLTAQLSAYEKAMGLLENKKPLPPVQKGGYLYRTHLHTTPENLLDWHEPINEQPAYGRLRKVAADAFGDEVDKQGRAVADTHTAGSGEALWHALANKLGGEEEARQFLYDHDIHGSTYLGDRFRNGGEPARNYVMYHHARTEILDKNGEPVKPQQVVQKVEELSKGYRAARTLRDFAQRLMGNESGAGPNLFSHANSNLSPEAQHVVSEAQRRNRVIAAMPAPVRREFADLMRQHSELEELERLTGQKHTDEINSVKARQHELLRNMGYTYKPYVRKAFHVIEDEGGSGPALFHTSRDEQGHLLFHFGPGERTPISDEEARAVHERDAKRFMRRGIVKNTGIANEHVANWAGRVDPFWKMLSRHMPEWEEGIAKGDARNTLIGMLHNYIQHRSEGATIDPNSGFSPIADMLRAFAEEKRAMLEEGNAKGYYKSEHYKEDYERQAWTDPNGFDKVFGTGTGKTGNRSTLMHSTVPDTLTGIDNGLKPRYMHPLENALHDLGATVLYHSAAKQMKEAEDAGYAYWDSAPRHPDDVQLIGKLNERVVRRKRIIKEQQRGPYTAAEKAKRLGYEGGLPGPETPALLGHEQPKIEGPTEPGALPPPQRETPQGPAALPPPTIEGEGREVPPDEPQRALPGPDAEKPDDWDDDEFEKIGGAIVQHRYAPSAAAKSWNDWLSRGLYGRPGAKGFLDVARHFLNASRMVAMIDPLYHATASCILPYANAMMRLGADLGHADLKGAVKEASWFPLAPLKAAYEGRAARSSYKRMDGDPALRALIENGHIFTKRPRQTEMGSATNIVTALYHGTLWPEIKQELHQFTQSSTVGQAAGHLIGMFGHEFGRVLTTVTAPLMDELVPDIKNGIAMQNMATWMRHHPDASEEAVARQATRYRKNNDELAGEMNQDALFWPRSVKQAAQMAFLSFSYTYGRVRLLASALGVDLEREGGGGFNPTAVGSVIGVVATYAMLNSLYQYFKTGQTPLQTGTPFSDMFIGGRNGATNPDGSPSRTLLPGIPRDAFDLYGAGAKAFHTPASIDNGFDVPALLGQLVGVLLNRLNAPMQIAKDIVKGTNWQDSHIQEMPGSWAAHIERRLSPFVLQQFEHQAPGLSWPETAFGFRQVPMSVGDPARFGQIQNWLVRKRTMQALARSRKEQAQRSQTTAAPIPPPNVNQYYRYYPAAGR